MVNAELVLRLKEAVDKNIPLVADLDRTVVDNLAGEGFDLGERWKV